MSKRYIIDTHNQFETEDHVTDIEVNTGMMDGSIYITNTTNTVVQTYNVIGSDDNQPNRSLMPEIHNISTMALKKLREELGKMGIVKKGNKLEAKNRLLHAYNTGVACLNEEELVQAKLLLRKRSKIAKVSLQPDEVEQYSKMVNIMNEDGHTKSVEKCSLMHLHFNFMLKLKIAKINNGESEGRLIVDLADLTFEDVNSSMVVGEWISYLKSVYMHDETRE